MSPSSAGPGSGSSGRPVSSSSMGKARTSVGPFSPIQRSCSVLMYCVSTQSTDSSAIGLTFISPSTKRQTAASSASSTAISDSLATSDGEFLVLVGPSGCGKSTALRMLAGLEEVTDGRILIGDRVVNDVAPGDRDVAMVFQSYALYPQMTVYDNLAFGLRNARMPRRERSEEHTSELQSRQYLVCRLLLEKKKTRD